MWTIQGCNSTEFATIVSLRSFWKTHPSTALISELLDASTGLLTSVADEAAEGCGEISHLIPSLKHIPLSWRSNFSEMMGGKPHQNVWPWVKPKPLEARFLRFILCEQASPPYHGAGGNRIAFHTKGLLQRNRGGRKPRLGTHSHFLTHAQESLSHMASSKAVYFFRAWLNYGEWWVTSAEA